MNDNILPADFDGVFRFTNFSNEEFKGRWNNVEYSFPPLKTTPMLIANQTPEEVQYIRKKFARDLAVREFYKTPKFAGMNVNVPGGVPAIYTDSDLTPFIQKCLEPLPIGQVKAKKLEPIVDVTKLREDNEGNHVTEVVKDHKKSFKQGSGSTVA